MSFFVPDYWPQPALGKPRIFDYFNKDGSPCNQRSVFTRMPDGSISQYDYVNGVWKDRWLLRYDIKRGVIEFGDDYPTTGTEAAIIGPLKRMRFKPGKEILWGAVQDVNDHFSVPVECDALASTMIPMQALFTKGNQAIYFTGRVPSFTDVLGQKHGDTILCFYQQDWNGGDDVGALYWFEKGVGPVQIQWASKYNMVGDPIAAKVS